MAAQSSAPNPHANSYLSRNQQDLLYAALNSQADQTHHPIKRSSSDPEFLTMSTINGNFISPQNAELDKFDAELDYTPDMDFLDDSGFDFENADLGGEMIGALPGRENTGDGHEKRKSRDDAGESEEGDAKRQETQEGERGGAKKPGRKPLTSEPTTVDIHPPIHMHGLLLTIVHRNVKHKTGQRNALSVSGRRSTLRIWRPR